MEHHPIRVMIVDDHLMVRDGLRLFLSKYDDLEVVAEADDGQQVLALCRETKPDVILMDMVMPVMDDPTNDRSSFGRAPGYQGRCPDHFQ